MFEEIFRLKMLCIILLSGITNFAYSQLTTPQILSSNMVLQQNQNVPVWGTAEPNETITVFFEKQRIKVRADVDGKWEAVLKPMTANRLPQKMIIKGKKTNLTYDNILIGEVWLCSGQSNMEYRMKLIPQFAPPAIGADSAALELKKPANTMIRVFNCDRKNPQNNTWKTADSLSLVNTSAAGYFFGKKIQQQLNVPVGIITSAIGGTRIESWTTREAYEDSPLFSNQLKNNNGKIDGFRPGNWYSTMIAPLVPFAIKGFLWYQGESNCAVSDRQYAKKFEVLVNSWRDTFNVSDAPFYYVLLAPHIYSDRLHKRNPYPITAEGLPLFREQQMKAQSLVSNCEYIVVSDLVDDLRDIHPAYKWEVGSRLARLALAKKYGMKQIIWSGPRISNTSIANDSIVVSFDYCAEGLKTNDNKRLLWFEIAAENGIFHPAIADIKDKNKVVVWNPAIKHPAKVRLGWHETAIPNLVNSEGLPVSPFNSK